MTGEMKLNVWLLGCQAALALAGTVTVIEKVGLIKASLPQTYGPQCVVLQRMFFVPNILTADLKPYMCIMWTALKCTETRDFPWRYSVSAPLLLDCVLCRRLQR